MVDERSRGLGRITQLLFLVAFLLAVLVALQFTEVSQFDPYGITAWTLVAGTLLAVSAIAIPAYLFSKWESEREAVIRNRRQ